jgi:hypothetical protein
VAQCNYIFSQSKIYMELGDFHLVLYLMSPILVHANSPGDEG